jgi:uridylate kinase
VVLKGTRVDGIYTADPEKDPNATRFAELSYNSVIQKGPERNGYDRFHTLQRK